jgi:hypothetical protein
MQMFPSMEGETGSVDAVDTWHCYANDFHVLVASRGDFFCNLALLARLECVD